MGRDARIVPRSSNQVWVHERHLEPPTQRDQLFSRRGPIFCGASGIMPGTTSQSISSLRPSILAMSGASGSTRIWGVPAQVMAVASAFCLERRRATLVRATVTWAVSALQTTQWVGAKMCLRGSIQCYWSARILSILWNCFARTLLDMTNLTTPVDTVEQMDQTICAEIGWVTYMMALSIAVRNGH